MNTDKFKGALLGLAVGDAVGTTVEFMSPDMFYPVTDMTGGGPFNLEAGQWTDDTSLALCLAMSLNEFGYNVHDQMNKYVQWMDEGYMSSNGRCFDIGFTTRNALNDYKDLGDPYSGEPSSHAAGNGSLMRLAPVPMYFHDDSIEEAIAHSGDSSRTTHGALTCIDACRYFGSLIFKALNGADKEEILSNGCGTELFGYFSHKSNKLCPEILEIAMGSYKIKQPPEIKGSGYVVKSLEAALWAFYNTDNFKDAVLDAVNLGDDADTTAAICGQIAGAYYGMEGIPSDWLDKLTMKYEIEEMAVNLMRG